jgi:adenylate kinase family enzyme
VVGNSGSGKSKLARRIAERIEAEYTELDQINHLENWTAIDSALFTEQVSALCARDSWVIDGNYRRVTVDGPIWASADTVVWLHLPRSIVMKQIIRRTIRRVITREELWNGNSEPWGNLYRWNPDKSVIRWAWTQHRKYDERYGAAMFDEKYRHLRFIELRSHAEAEDFLRGLSSALGPT